MMESAAVEKRKRSSRTALVRTENGGDSGVIKNVVAAMVAVVGFALTCSGMSEDQSTPPQEGSENGTAIRLQVQIRPGFGAGDVLVFFCPGETYTGECSSRARSTEVRMAISGKIQEITKRMFLTSYDLEVRFADRSSMTRFSAAGSALLTDGKPTSVVVIAGRSVVMTASLVNRSTEAGK